MNHLNDMSLFVEVVKAKSFRGAATAIGMPISTLSRRINELEKAVGLRLLNRTTRKIELTEAGALYYERCRHIVEEARIAHVQLGDMLAQPTGILRVSLPVDLATTYLAPLIADFARAYPGIGFELDLTPRRVDLVSEPYDLAIRMGDLSDSGLIARQLGRVRRFLYASPTYLNTIVTPRAPSDLAGLAFISMPRSGAWTFSDGVQEVRVAAEGRFVVNSVGMMRSLALEGQGVALLPEEIVGDDVRDGRLSRILPEWEGSAISVHAVTETKLLPAKTQRFIEFLQERFRRL